MTRVLRFCEKHNFTKSRRRDASPRESFARSPGRRSVTSADALPAAARMRPGESRRRIRDAYKLGDDGKIAVIGVPGWAARRTRDFGLNDDVYFVDEVGKREQVMKDRRGNVVGKIAVDADAATGSNGGTSASRMSPGTTLRCRNCFVRWRRPGWNFGSISMAWDGSASRKKVLGHLTVSRTNFDPAMLIVLRKRHGGMRRNANGASNLFAPVEIGEEVLARRWRAMGETV